MASSVKADAEFLRRTELQKDHLLHLQCTDLCRESQFRHTRKVEAVADGLTEILSPLQPDIILPTQRGENAFVLRESANAKVLPTFRYLVLIPNSTFQSKDYREGVYFHKRSKLLTRIAQNLESNWTKLLSKTTPTPAITWRYWKQDRRKREILLTMDKFRFVVQLGMESLDWIQPLRLVPNRNNRVYGPPDRNSVYYNFLLTEDATHTYYDPAELTDEYPNASDAMTLLQIWALQRGFWRGIMDVDDMSALLLYVFRTKRANARMTPLQVLTAVWKLLATTDTTWVHVIPSASGVSESQTIANCPLAQKYAEVARLSPLTDSDPPTLVELWKEQAELHPVTLLDSSMRHNFCIRWSHHWSSIQREAMVSLEDSNNDFRSLFLETRRFWTRHDAYCRLAWNGSGSRNLELSTNDILSTLRRALGKRVVEMQPWTTGNGSIPTTSPDHDSDEIPSYAIGSKAPPENKQLILGFSVDPTAIDIVDRGPPMDDTKGVEAFRNLWGEKAELRRFKDGAIIYAVVWETKEDSLSNSNGWQAELVERVIQHVVATHFGKQVKETPKFAWKNIVSVVDGVSCTKEHHEKERLVRSAMAAHRAVWSVFDDFSTLLREQTAKTIREGNEYRSPLGLPLSIDAVEPLGSALRYAELFPPLPHPQLGGRSDSTKKVSGAVSFNPIEIQIRFGSSSKWPNDLKAIGAAKTAMLVELTRGLEQLKVFRGVPQAVVTPNYADFCYKGYVWRVFVRADPELKLLRSLSNPTNEATQALMRLTRSAVVAPSHHTMVHAVYTSNPSSSAVFRLAKRWLSSHLIQLPSVPLELMVCSLYQGKNKPGTVFRGFERWLSLLISFDWMKEPLIVDPVSLLTANDRAEILNEFEKARGTTSDKGPSLYIVSPCDKVVIDETSDKPRTSWVPYFAVGEEFERVVLCRAIALARRTHGFIDSSLRNFDDTRWPAIFTESPDAFRSYSALLRIDPHFLVDVSTSSTVKQLGTQPSDGSDEQITSFSKSMRALQQGPKALRRTNYCNLPTNYNGILLEWSPVVEAVRRLRAKLGRHALFLYNDLCPEVVAVVWRQHCRSSQTFSAIESECTKPLDGDMVVFNAKDCLREVKSILEGLVTDIRVFDWGPAVAPRDEISSPTNKRKRPREEASDDIGGKSSSSSDEDRNSSSSSEEGGSGSSTEENGSVSSDSEDSSE